MDTVAVQVSGTAVLLMHNVRLANPLDEYTKSIKLITSKPKKTDADYAEIFKWEFLGGLYYSDKIGPYIPSRMIRASIINGAKMLKLGTAVERTMLVGEAQAKLVYEGPRDRDKLYESGHYMDIRPVSGQGARGGSKTMRCRPMFDPPWSVAFTLSVEPTIISLDNLRQCVERAGAFHGIGDGRSEGNGRFEIVEWAA
jgi:hypothetical protein